MQPGVIIRGNKVQDPMNSENPKPFTGFNQEPMALVRVPESFFTELLPKIDSLTLLRLILYLFWHIEQQSGDLRYFLSDELESDPALLVLTSGVEGLRNALKDLLSLGVLLEARPTTKDRTYYFFNSPKGQSAVKAIEEGRWQEMSHDRVAINLREGKPNIFKLYEDNIGLITPIMADILKEDEEVYPADWIKEAIQMAVARNIRNWKYVQAILSRWHKEGRGNEQYRRDDSQDPESYRKSWRRQD